MFTKLKVVSQQSGQEIGEHRFSSAPQQGDYLVVGDRYLEICQRIWMDDGSMYLVADDVIPDNAQYDIL